ncbi:MAG: AAA family ATPase, partial [Pseudanabaena sp.]
IDDAEDDKDILEFASNLKNTNSAKSSLNITAYNNYNNQLQKNVFVTNSNGSIGRGMEHTFFEVNFIPANYKLSPEQLAKEFDNAKLAKKSKVILRAFQIIDANIEEVDTFNLGESALYLRSNNEDYMLLSLFGDAMNRIADFVLKIVNTKNSVLLVDEIENGIHYENQEEVWNILFSLCKEYDVQLFATSHSYEMIEAFKNCAMREEYQDNASYFEMLKHPVSHQTIIQKIPLLSLDDKLNNHKPVRGEK